MSIKEPINLDTLSVLRNVSNEVLKIPNHSFRAVIENSKDFYRIVAECDVHDFYDNFNGIELISTSIELSSNETIEGIELSCRVSDPHQFFMIALDFLNYIEQNGPQPNLSSWVESWKQLMGNKYSNNMVYDVLAELLVYSYLQSCNMNPTWSGPDHERHDFRCPSIDCEVKSTVSRTTDPIIHIQGGGQLGEGGKPVKLFVCQFEAATNGELTVKKLINDLLAKGVDKTELRNQFRKTGLNSTIDQQLRFNLLHPIKVYDINSKFPRIDKKDFKNNCLPQHIINVSYTVSLSGLKHSEITVSDDNGNLIFSEQVPSEIPKQF